MRFFLYAFNLSIGTVMLADSEIEGRVELPKGHAAPVAAKRYEIVSNAGVLSASPPIAVVYLEGNLRRAAANATTRVEQKNLAFIPPLLAVQTGTRVEFPNLDDVYHNIFSYSPAKRFDLGRYRKDETPVPAQVFDKAGLITLRCDVHEHMRGLILVVDSPFFQTTDPAGHFRLPGIPAGHYKLKAWINSQTTREREIDVPSAGTLHVDFP